MITEYCLTYCPTGLKEDYGLRKCVSESDQLVLHYRFEKIGYEASPKTGAGKATLGSDTTYYPTAYGGDDPIPVRGRGVYFDGSDIITLSNGADAIILNVNMTFEAWAKVINKNGWHTFFGKYSTAGVT
jgi:hypothetical protein